MSDATSRLAPALADRYRLDRELGQGGMATVYLAHDLKHDRDVALKVLRPELAAVLGRERFIAEIRLTARLDHPHILTLIDSGESDGFLWYVVPFIRGESLRQKLTREKQLAVEEALGITKQVAGALDYAHHQGVIHRDIKPENILLHEGEAMLADFGIALAVKKAAGNRLTESGLSLGTPQYMSPEQATGDRQLDARSDVYSLAAVLYEMLTGEPPHTGATVQAVIAKLMTERPTPLRVVRDSVPEQIDAAVARALAKVPADRFASVAQFATTLVQAGLTAKPRTARSGVHRRWVVGLGLIAALAVVGALIRRPRHPARLDPRRIVVAPFENRTGDPALDQLGLMAADWLTQGLTGTRMVEVVGSRSLIASVRAVREAGAQGDLAQRLALETRAGTLVSGSVYRLGDSLRLQAQVTDVASGRLRGTVDPVIVSAANPGAALEPLRQRVTGVLASLLDARLNNQAAASSTPPTYAAYQEFLLGMEHYFARPEEDLKHFRRAAELDSSYAQALLWLGIEYSDLEQYKSADSVFQILERHRAQLLPYDQANLDYFSRGFVHGDWEGSYQGARRMLEAEPGAEHAKWAVALCAEYNNRPREALELVAQVDTSAGWGKSWRFGVMNVEAWSRHRLGRYEDELRGATIMTADPDTAIARWGRLLRLRALLGLHRRDEAIALLQGGDGFGLHAASREFYAHGYPEDGRRTAVMAADWLRRHLAAHPDSGVSWRGALALVLFDAGQLDEAREAVRNLRGEDPTEPMWAGVAGVIAARRGDSAEVTRALRALSQWPGSYQFGAPAYWRARILAALHQPDEAIAALQQAVREGYRAWGRNRRYSSEGLHFISEDFDFVRNDPRFLALVEPAG